MLPADIWLTAAITIAMNSAYYLPGRWLSPWPKVRDRDVKGHHHKQRNKTTTKTSATKNNDNDYGDNRNDSRRRRLASMANIYADNQILQQNGNNNGSPGFRCWTTNRQTIYSQTVSRQFESGEVETCIGQVFFPRCCFCWLSACPLPTSGRSYKLMLSNTDTTHADFWYVYTVTLPLTATNRHAMDVIIESRSHGNSKNWDGGGSGEQLFSFLFVSVFEHPLLCCNYNHSNINCRPPYRTDEWTDNWSDIGCVRYTLHCMALLCTICASDTPKNALHLLWLYLPKGSGIYCGNCNHTYRDTITTTTTTATTIVHMCWVLWLCCGCCCGHCGQLWKNWMTICLEMLNYLCIWQSWPLRIGTLMSSVQYKSLSPNILCNL